MSASQALKAGRRPTNISLDSELLRDAREFNVNVSRACEQGLIEEVRKRKWAKWQEDNKGAIDAYNAYVEKHGLMSEYFHDFGNGVRKPDGSDGAI
jgi:antitoxin CcdA